MEPTLECNIDSIIYTFALFIGFVEHRKSAIRKLNSPINFGNSLYFLDILCEVQFLHKLITTWKNYYY